MASRIFAAALLLPPLWAGAAELDGVKLEDQVRVDGQPLQLNGMGLRTRYFFKVYVAGLYLPHKAGTADAAIDAPGAKRIVLVMRREASADEFCASIDAGLRANNSEGQLEQVKGQTEALYAMIRAKAHAHTGMQIVLDYAPSSGATTLYADEAALGPAMPGEDFFRALLRIWLGAHPVQTDLKESLLGQRQAAAN